jgi:hypothetical protein
VFVLIVQLLLDQLENWVQMDIAVYASPTISGMQVLINANAIRIKILLSSEMDIALIV